jgi:hypothetical protein
MQNDESGSGPDAPAQPPAALTDEAFAAALLRALVGMAARSKRRQADLTAALRGAGLPAEPARVRAALRLLRQQGCIDNLVPLSDGGLLLSVTATALGRFGTVPRWLPLGDDDEGG